MNPPRLKSWLLQQRSSTRLTFALQMACRVLTSVCALVWTPLILASMGRSLNGLFINFQSLASLGGLGDLGMGGLVNIQTSRLLGRSDAEKLQHFLAATRALYAVLAAGAVAVFFAASPSVFRALGFNGDSGEGSLACLALAGAVAVALVVLNSYTANLNYGCGNILWPVLPAFLIMQLGLLGHWLLARQHSPLWLQYLPYAAGTLLTLVMGWWMVRLSHPALAHCRPLVFDRSQFTALSSQSFWIYFTSIAGGLYMVAGQFFVSRGFGPATVPVYRYNFRLCELALFIVNSANLASVPKITQWWNSSDSALRERARTETERLNKFQTLLGCAAALGYLAVNGRFMRLWLGPDMGASSALQGAFACHLAFTAAGLAGFDLAARCHERGIRTSGITVLTSALLNLALAWAAMRHGSLAGIAAAAAIAQSVVTLALGRFTARHMNLSWWRLSCRNWLLALAVVTAGLAAQTSLPPQPARAIPILLALDLCVLLGVARIVGIGIEDLQREKEILLGIIRPARKNPQG